MKMHAPWQWLVPCLGASLIWASTGCEPDRSATAAPSAQLDSSAQVGSAPTVSATAASKASAARPSDDETAAIVLPYRARKYHQPELVAANLERNIANQQRALDHDSPDIAPRLALVGLLSERASRLGRISDLDTVAKLGDELTERYAERPRAWLGRARALSAVHRFDEALAALDKAKELRASPALLDPVRATILLGQGHYPKAYELLKKQRESHASPANLTLEAIALSRLGRNEEAERGFVQAVEAQRDVSPLLPAWIAFEHGNKWSRQGDDKRAAALYREAVRLLPQYAHAAAHLAGLASDEEAIALFNKLLKSSDDPEYPASLARLLEKRDAPRSTTLMKEAMAAYDKLLAKHEAAFADHAGWFYLETPGKLDRARELVERAVKERPGVPEIHELRLAVHMRGEKREALCAAHKAADKLPHKTAGLQLWIDAAAKKCR